VLLAGTRLAVIDNVDDRLASGALASALTAGEVTDRILGKTEMVRVENTATWIATGNNLGVGGDLPRRCYLIRMDAQMARPWERSGFTHDPLKPWVRERRGDLVAAVLTLARAWFAAGKPAAQVRPLGSFEEWSQTIGSILAFAGVQGFLANLPQFYARADDDARQWEGFLHAWLRELADRVVTVAEIVVQLRADTPESVLFRSALPDDLGEVLEKDSSRAAGFQKRLGKALAKRDGVQYGELRLERAGEDAHTRTVLWRVVRIGGGEDAGTVLRGLRSLAGCNYSGTTSCV
jgi:hypothetical protein